MLNNTSFYPLGYNNIININVNNNYKYNQEKEKFIYNDASNRIQKKDNKIFLGEKSKLW